jgi:YidC/Oxa1 family membrane protein insertase
MLGNLWNTILYEPFLNLLVLLYHFFGDNLGLAVIVIAVIVRLALIPAVKNQMDMMRKMSALKPKLDKLQKKYAANQEQLSKEQMKLYKDAGYNPIGCVGNMVPQILILYVIIQVIRVATTNDFTGLYGWVENYVFASREVLTIDPYFLGIDLTRNYNELAKEFGYFAPNGVSYLALALSVGVVQYFSSEFMKLQQGTPKSTKKKSNKDEPMSPEEMSSQMTNSMTKIFPIMTAVISMGAPAVLGLYWFAQSLMLIVQYFIIDFKKAKETFREVIGIDKLLTKKNG